MNRVAGELPMDQGLYYSAVNLWGTTEPWREGGISVLERQGVWPTGWYDPIIPRGESRPGNIFVEVYRARTNLYDATSIGPKNRGLISEIEFGHTAVKLVLGGTQGYLDLSQFTGDDETSVRARRLVTTAVDQMQALLPAGSLDVADPALDRDERQVRFHDWLLRIGERIMRAQQNGDEWTSATPPLLQAQQPGEPQVFLSGTSVATSDAKEVFNAEAARLGLVVADSYTGSTFSEDDIQSEYRRLRVSQVAAVMITNDTETRAGTVEAPVRAALAAMNRNRPDDNGDLRQQAFGLFVEEPDEAKLSPYAVELRRALLLHARAIQLRFPDAIHLVQSPAELAAWAHSSIAQ